MLQEKKVRKVGATAEEAVDVRIVSATHQNLAALVEAGRFRQDLYYRLNVIDLVMPSLRERAEDIPEMARFLLDKLGGAEIKLDRDAEKALRAYAFPGNVRELENTLERALALCETVPSAAPTSTSHGPAPGQRPPAANTRCRTTSTRPSARPSSRHWNKRATTRPPPHACTASPSQPALPLGAAGHRIAFRAQPPRPGIQMKKPAI